MKKRMAVMYQGSLRAPWPALRSNALKVALCRMVSVRLWFFAPALHRAQCGSAAAPRDDGRRTTARWIHCTVAALCQRMGLR